MNSVVTHKRGDTYRGFKVNFSYSQIDGVVQDPVVPINLTDSKIRIKFRFGSKRANVNYEFSTEDLDSKITIIDGPNGTIECLKDEIIDWTYGDWYFDIQVEFPDGKIKTLFDGIFTVKEDITR